MYAIFRWAIRAAFGIALLWHPAVAGAANEIGNVNNVMHVAYGTMPAQPRAELRPGEQVVSKEIIETTAGAALHIKFIDNSDFHLGSASRATLDKFLYDPQSQGGQMALLLKEGNFRFKTGQMKASGIRVVTPVAIITPKGTEFLAQVLPSREIIVSVISGAVTITPLAQASVPVTVSAPDTAQVSANGDVQVGVEPPSLDEGIELLARLATLETEGPVVTGAGPTGGTSTADSGSDPVGRGSDPGGGGGSRSSDSGGGGGAGGGGGGAGGGGGGGGGAGGGGGGPDGT